MDIRVLIIEDEMIIARFIEQNLQHLYEGLNIHIALSVEEVESIFPEFRPQLVLCDIELHDVKDGIELMEEYKNLYAFELIFITSYQSMNVMNRAFTVHPENYIIKPLDESRIYAGCNASMQRLLKAKNNDSSENTLEALTTSEIEIIRLIVQRLTTKQIADKLFLSPYTVKNSRHRICRKLNLAEENNALLAWALNNQHLL